MIVDLCDYKAIYGYKGCGEERLESDGGQRDECTLATMSVGEAGHVA